MAGSLIINIIVYVLSTSDEEHSICSSDVYWIEYINPAFEFLKRLNGFYIFVYIFSGKHNFVLIKRKVADFINKTSWIPRRSEMSVLEESSPLPEPERRANYSSTDEAISKF